MSGLTYPIYLLHKLTSQILFYRNYIINHVIEIFEKRYKIENLKIGSLNLKFENWEFLN